MGWWTSNFVEAGGFAATKLGTPEYPDVQFHFTPIYRSHRGRKFEFGHGYSLFTCLLRPHSKGSVKLKSDGNKYQVLIDHNFLSDSRDEANIVEAIKKAREVLSSKEFDEVRGEEMAPGNLFSQMRIYWLIFVGHPLQSIIQLEPVRWAPMI
jgi:choline dehydrogenase-like flavoprotein